MPAAVLFDEQDVLAPSGEGPCARGTDDPAPDDDVVERCVHPAILRPRTTEPTSGDAG